MCFYVPRYFHHSYNGTHEDLQSGITRDLSNKESIFRNRPSPLVIVASHSLSLTFSGELFYNNPGWKAPGPERRDPLLSHHLAPLSVSYLCVKRAKYQYFTIGPHLYSFFPLAPSVDYHSSHWPPQLSISLFCSFFLIQSPSPSTFLANQP